MPKTKDAFALRGFDSERILQRPWFKDCNLPVDEDSLIKENFFSNVSDLRDASERLNKVERLNDCSKNYLLHLRTHEARLKKVLKIYSDKYLSSKDKKIKAQYQRALDLRGFYFELYWNVMTIFYNEIITSLFLTGNLIFLGRCRIKLSARLKESRKAIGLTQKDVAEKLGLTRNAYTLYENGKRDIPTHILTRLAIIFNQSTDWLLGIQD